MGHSLVNCGTQSASLCAHMHEHLISGSPALPLAFLSILQIISHVIESKGKTEPGPIIPQPKHRQWATSIRLSLRLTFITNSLLTPEKTCVVLHYNCPIDCFFFGGGCQSLVDKQNPHLFVLIIELT